MTVLLIGLAAAAFAALLCLLLIDPPALPDRTAEAPPRAFRLAWPLVSAAAHYGRPWLSWQRRRRIEFLLVQAGLRHGLAPVHILERRYCAPAPADSPPPCWRRRGAGCQP